MYQIEYLKLTVVLIAILLQHESFASPAMKTHNSHEKSSANELVNPSQLTFQLNKYCIADVSLDRVVCTGLTYKEDLPKKENYFDDIQQAVFINLSVTGGDIHISDLKHIFPNLILLSINQSPNVTREMMNSHSHNKRKTSQVNYWQNDDSTSSISNNPKKNDKNDTSIAFGYNVIVDEGATSRDKHLVWESVKFLNLSRNELQSIPPGLFTMFPNIEQLDLSQNSLQTLTSISNDHWLQLSSIDLSGNPLDCTSDLDWIDNVKILNSEDTLCEKPPHQNKPKPIIEVLPLVQKVKEECRVNCTCTITYIWERNHVIHSKTEVNCSNRGFFDFPDPEKLPHQIDTLYLNNNEITSMKRFVDDVKYANMHLHELYLDNNKISSINILEGSDWFYQFHVFSIRRNNLTKVPEYALENVLKQNTRILYIDLSLNEFKCDCSTMSFKLWLLRYAANVKHVDDVRCHETGEQIRYLKFEDWCKKEDDGTTYIEILDILSITLAVLIVTVICKVYYDYRNFKKNGTLPFLVRKM